MLTLYLTRHAKSSKDDPALRDFDRPLNDRGLRDAPFMAQEFTQRREPVDRLVSSPAKRAFTTARHFALALGLADQDIVQDDRVYLADAGLLMRVLNSLSDDAARRDALRPQPRLQRPGRSSHRQDHGSFHLRHRAHRSPCRSLVRRDARFGDAGLGGYAQGTRGAALSLHALSVECRKLTLGSSRVSY